MNRIKEIHPVPQSAGQRQILYSVLNWEEQRYCEHQFEEYISFLTRLFVAQPDQMLKQVMYSKRMRDFWNREWNARNELEFLPFALDLTCGEIFLVDQYQYLHHHRLLIHDDAFMHRYNEVLSRIKEEEDIVC